MVEDDWSQHNARCDATIAGGEGVGGSSAYKNILEKAEAFAADPDDDCAADDERTLLRSVVDDVLSRCKEQNRLASIQVIIEGKSPADVAQESGNDNECGLPRCLPYQE